MTPVTTWGAQTPSGGSAGNLPFHMFPAKAGGARSERSFSFASKRLPLFADVKLVRPWRAEGESLPSGASGTIVEVFDGGNAYIIEFFEPHHCVMTVYDHALTPESA